MDRIWISYKKSSKSYRRGVEEFINFVSWKPLKDGKMACPCNKCENLARLKKCNVRRHLLRHGFDRDYGIWICHGESAPTACFAVGSSGSTGNNSGKIKLGNDSKPSGDPEDYAGLPRHAKKGGKVGKRCQQLDDQKMMAFAYHLNKLRKNHGWSEESFDRLISSLKAGFPLFDRLPKYSNYVQLVFQDPDMTIPNWNGRGCSSLNSPKENPGGRGKKCRACGQDLKSHASRSKSSRKKKRTEKKKKPHKSDVYWMECSHLSFSQVLASFFY